MAEIEINEIVGEVTRDQEIMPRSEINMSDCNKFWESVFGGEIAANDMKSVSLEKNKENRPEIKSTYENRLKDFFRDFSLEHIQSIEGINSSEEINQQEGLTPEEKNIIKKETGWSDEIVDTIRSMEEYKIYKEAGLVEGEVNGKKCLMRTDIDWEQKDPFGMTNRERVAEGYASLDKTGKPIQLHHIGQHADSPLAELTFNEHRTGGNDTILHDKTRETEVHGEGNNWDHERQDYWKNRQPNGGGSNE